MASELIIVGTIRDARGRTVKVGYRGAEVEIVVTPHSGRDGRIALETPEQHLAFAGAYAQACQHATGTPPAAAIQVTDLCTARAPAAGGDWWICAEPDGHPGDGWHYDAVADVTWLLGRLGMKQLKPGRHLP